MKNMKYQNVNKKELFSQNLEFNRNTLQADCENCFGLCCIALYFSVSEGFPTNKDAGLPCLNLQPDFRCKIHNDLCKKGLKGCFSNIR